MYKRCYGHIFKVFVKRLEPMKNVPQTVYQMHEDMKRFYRLALRYVLSFLNLYYKNDPPKHKELKEDNDSDNDNNDDNDSDDDNKEKNLQDITTDNQKKCEIVLLWLNIIFKFIHALVCLVFFW